MTAPAPEAPLRPALWLAHSAESPESLRRRLPPGARWAYLGRDYLRLRRWEKGLGPQSPRADLGESLQRIAAELRQPFLRYLGELGRRHASLEWWTSLIAEENTLAGSLFLDVCYLKAAQSLLAQEGAPTLIVAENRAVLEALRQDGRSRLSDAWGPLKGLAADVFLNVRRWAVFFLRGARAWALARLTRRGPARPPRPQGRPIVLLHTCVGPGYFGADGPRDSYYGPLPAELRKRGCAVVTLPWLYNPDKSLRQTLLWLRSRPEEFLIPEDFYRPGDYLWASRVIRGQSRLPELPQSFAGLDISPLIARARRRQTANISAAAFVLYERLFERLSRQGFRPDVFIDMWENAIPEKPQTLALRRHSPGTMIVGFQHLSSLPPLMLNLFTASDPSCGAPMPDVLVCNSRFTRGILVREGFPESRLRVGPSLRCLHLLQPATASAREPGAVLVGLSLDAGEACELLCLLTAAFPAAEGLRFWIKPHPMLPPADWRAVLAEVPLPGHMEVVSGPLSAWSARASCAVIGASTAAMELALAGVPVALAGRGNALDFNSLAYFPQWRPPSRDAAALRQEVLRLTSLTPEQRQELDSWTRWARAECLSPLDDATVDAFLKPMVS